jgi:hypothetical protein
LLLNPVRNNATGFLLPTAFRLLLFLYRQTGALPRGEAAEQRGDVVDIFALECLRRTGA